MDPGAAKQGSKTNAGPPGVVSAVKHRYDPAPATPKARHRVAVAVLVTCTPGAGVLSGENSAMVPSAVPDATVGVAVLAVLVGRDVASVGARDAGDVDDALCSADVFVRAGAAVVELAGRAMVADDCSPATPHPANKSAASTMSPTSSQNHGLFMCTASSKGHLDGRSLAGMLFTVGHGTLEITELTDLLVGAGISILLDVRSYPGSRRYPHFAREALERSIPAAGVGYEWRPALGGRRKPQPESVNLAWRHPSFRAYADYMATAPFLDALDRLVADAAQETVAVMCAESLWWRCHRRLIADGATLLRDVEVRHLFHDGHLQVHPPTPSARVDPRGILVYDLGTTPQMHA